MSRRFGALLLFSVGRTESQPTFGEPKRQRLEHRFEPPPLKTSIPIVNTIGALIKSVKKLQVLIKEESIVEYGPEEETTTCKLLPIELVEEKPSSMTFKDEHARDKEKKEKEGKLVDEDDDVCASF